jgi:hypothetical protein
MEGKDSGLTVEQLVRIVTDENTSGLRLSPVHHMRLTFFLFSYFFLSL